MNETAQLSTLHNATLVSRLDLDPSLAILRVQPDDGVLPEFTPGQHSVLGLAVSPQEADMLMPRPSGKPYTQPQRLMRHYTIASAPTQRAYLEFVLVLVPGGALTPRLWTLKEGDHLFMSPRVGGKLTLDGVPPHHDLLMIATGTGIAPFLSILRASRGARRLRRCVLIHSTRRAADLVGRDELEQIASNDPSVTYLPTVTREPQASSWRGLRERIPALLDSDRYAQLTGHHLTPNQSHIFLCGNPAMIDQVTADLTQRGFTDLDRDVVQGNIVCERYW